MQAHIRTLKPNAIEISELRAGDNFEFVGWIYKVVDLGTLLNITPHPSYVYATTESSGEVHEFTHATQVYPLLSVDVSFDYDLDGQYKKEREE